MSTALFLMHKTKPGSRDEVEQVWRKHMPAAIEANEGHERYFYCYSEDPDQIVVYQQYVDADAAAAFLQNPAYVAYLAEVESLLEGPPQVIRAIPRWSKN